MNNPNKTNNEERRSIDSYFFSLKETGNPKIDAILYTLADVAERLHHTKQWEDEGCIDEIQKAADDAARSLTSKPVDAAEVRRQALEDAAELLRGNWHGVSLDGRNEHGSHVLNLPQRSIELEQDEYRDFLKEDAETILSDAERLGFSMGDSVVAVFTLCKGDNYDSWYEYSGISLELTELFYGSAKEQFQSRRNNNDQQ